MRLGVEGMLPDGEVVSEPALTEVTGGVGEVEGEGVVVFVAFRTGAETVFSGVNIVVADRLNRREVGI